MIEELAIFFICLMISAAISAVVMFVVRKNLKSVGFKRNACDYTRKNSFRVTNKSDIFLYRNISRIKKPQNKR